MGHFFPNLTSKKNTPGLTVIGHKITNGTDTGSRGFGHSRTSMGRRGTGRTRTGNVHGLMPEKQNDVIFGEARKQAADAAPPTLLGCRS